MLSSGILTLIGFACLALAFAAVAGRRGTATAVVSLCWVPLVALLLGLTVHQKLGYAAMSLVIAIVVASMTLALVGAALAIRAHRSGSGPVRALVSGTVVAAAPLVLLLGAWILGR